eukprot:2168-Eustigmatos_ZCMA.PRE.1
MARLTRNSSYHLSRNPRKEHCSAVVLASKDLTRIVPVPVLADEPPGEVGSCLGRGSHLGV